MKILLITDRLESGGAETHILSLARELTLLGAQVTITSGGGKMAESCLCMGIRHVDLPLPSRNPFRLWQVRQRLHKWVRREHFDIVHAHARIPALLIKGCHKYGAAEIVTVHAHFYVNRLLSRICYWGMHTIAVSEDLLSYVCRSYNLSPERVTVISNGIDCNRFVPALHKRDSNNRIGILFASRLDADCSIGAKLLCELTPILCETTPDLHVTIVGGGSEYSRILELARKANQSVGREVVTLQGSVCDMPAVLQKHDIFVGVSRAAMEAAACSCAVILCGNEGYFGILDGIRAESASKTNFCARGCPMPDPQRLESDLRFLVNDSSRRRRIADEGRAWIMEHCNIDSVCRKTMSVYQKARLSPTAKRILVGGYFGCGNLGDDAILAGLLEELGMAHKGIIPIILSGAPRRDRHRYGIRCIHRKNLLLILFSLLKNDAFLLGGGSLLQNVTSNRSLCYYLFLLRLAHVLRKPTVLYAAGIGPLLGEKAKKYTAEVLSGCRYISLRDDGSKQFLISIGVDASKLHAGADPALLIPPSTPAHLRLMLSDTVLNQLPQRFLCVVLKGGSRLQRLRAIVLAAARTVCQRRGLALLFAVFDTRHDNFDTRTIATKEHLPVIVCHTPLKALAVLSQAQVVLTMRLHAMILATATETPTLGICSDLRDEKLTAFAKLSGQEIFDEADPDVPTLAQRLELLLEKQNTKALLSDAVDELRKKAQKDLANIAEMIYNIDSKA